MTQSDKDNSQNQIDMLEQVDQLNEEVKTLALTLAIHLAKAKKDGRNQQIIQIEPQFVRLINGAVRVVQELTVILDAAKHRENVPHPIQAAGTTAPSGGSSPKESDL